MVLIRTLFPNEIFRYREHLLRLSAEDRRLRFGNVVADGVIDAYVDGIDPARDRILVHMDGSLAVIGAVHISTSHRHATELAFSVEKPARGAGLGTQLAERAILWNRNRGIRRVTICCLPENRAMRRLSARIGMPMTTEDGLCEGTLDLAGATPLSVLRETAQETAAFVDASARWNARALRGFGLSALQPAA
jgi:RimJ/RimL family protein N-acetyltransferase